MVALREALVVALREALDETERLTRLPPDELQALDVADHRRSVNTLLLAASELVRADVGRRRAQHRGADLMGASLRGADLRGADLRLADLIGADLRGADLSGADLTGSLFRTQFQLAAATGDERTQVGPPLTRPAHWLSAGN